MCCREVVGSLTVPVGSCRWHGSLGGPGFYGAAVYCTRTPAPTLLRLEFVTCRFIFLTIKAPLQACGDAGGEWETHEERSGFERIKQDRPGEESRH